MMEDEEMTLEILRILRELPRRQQEYLLEMARMAEAAERAASRAAETAGGEHP